MTKEAMFFISFTFMNESKTQLISLLKDKYDYELNRKETFESALGTPIAVLSGLFAGIFFICSDETLKNVNCSLLTFKWLLLTLLIASCSLSIIMLFVVYFGFRRSYCLFPESSLVYGKDYKELEQYVKEHHNGDDSQLNELLSERIITWYVDCNTNNTGVNDKRGNALYYSKLFLCTSLSIGLTLLIMVSLIKAI